MHNYWLPIDNGSILTLKHILQWVGFILTTAITNQSPSFN
jgi:hypothetical protein